MGGLKAITKHSFCSKPNLFMRYMSHTNLFVEGKPDIMISCWCGYAFPKTLRTACGKESQKRGQSQHFVDKWCPESFHRVFCSGEHFLLKSMIWTWRKENTQRMTKMERGWMMMTGDSTKNFKKIDTNRTTNIDKWWSCLIYFIRVYHMCVCVIFAGVTFFERPFL